MEATTCHSECVWIVASKGYSCMCLLDVAMENIAGS